jgi:hypothetical protein
VNDTVIQRHDVGGLKQLRRVFPLLDKLRGVGARRDKAGNRQLHYDHYVKLVLLYTWNPAIESVRDLQRVVELPGVATAMGVRRFSAGSFSESVRLFEPRLLQAVVAELAGELNPLPTDPRLSQLKSALTVVDGSVLTGLPRLARAGAGVDADGVSGARFNTAKDGRGVYGHRLHLQLDLATFSPHKWSLTGGRNAGCRREHNVVRANLESGRCYVGDGGYADAALFDDVVKAGSNFVVRMRTDGVYDVVEERLVSDQALAAGLVRDAVVRLGPPPAKGKPDARPFRRIVEVQVEPHPHRTRTGTRQVDLVVVCTDLLELDADLVALIYRQRYTVELFFRFLKQLLGLRHLLSQRQQGIEIQIYCALIVTLVIHLMTGRKPDRGTAQMVGWYLMGLATEDDLLKYLNKPDNTGVKKRAKDELWKKLGVL